MNFNNYNYTWLNEHSSYPLREQLRHIRVPDLNELDEAMKQDRHLKKTLTTPLYRLPFNSQEYSYKYFSNLPMSITLYEAIKFCLEDFFNLGEFYYSGINGAIEGFLFYTVEGNTIKGTTPYIWDIGIVPFNLNVNDVALLKDTINLFKDLRKKYKGISWSVNKDSLAVKMYKKLVQTYEGYYKEDFDDSTCYRFYIEGDLE